MTCELVRGSGDWDTPDPVTGENFGYEVVGGSGERIAAGALKQHLEEFKTCYHDNGELALGAALVHANRSDAPYCLVSGESRHLSGGAFKHMARCQLLVHDPGYEALRRVRDLEEVVERIDKSADK